MVLSLFARRINNELNSFSVLLPQLEANKTKINRMILKNRLFIFLVFIYVSDNRIDFTQIYNNSSIYRLQDSPTNGLSSLVIKNGI
jgi:hypothetical protein